MESRIVKLIELITRLLCDTHYELTADAAYLFAQTQDNQDSVLSAASELLDKGLVRRILILKTAAKSGYPGFEHWKQKLNDSGVSDECIQGVSIDADLALNTLVEAEAMIDHAKLKRYGTIYIVASPFHQLRAYMTSVTAVIRRYPELNLYSYVGNSLPWQKSVAHSQGSSRGTRLTFISTELERIEKYQKKGDLASVGSVLDHLNKRETVN
jgi:hypothetical protein